MPHEENSKAMSEACKFCSDKGLDGMGPAMSILLNEAMASERSGTESSFPGACSQRCQVHLLT